EAQPLQRTLMLLPEPRCRSILANVLMKGNLRETPALCVIYQRLPRSPRSPPRPPPPPCPPRPPPPPPWPPRPPPYPPRPPPPPLRSAWGRASFTTRFLPPKF